MASKEEFLEILNNPAKVRGITKEQFAIYNRVIPAFMDFFNKLEPAKKLEWAVETSSYLFGKAMEITILGKIRPEEKAVWMVPFEVEEGITFDLPKHLENIVIDYMDPFENACEDFIKSNADVDFAKFWVFCEHFGVITALQDKLYEKQVAALSNEEIMTNNELYRFGMNAFKQQIERYGFEVKSISGNLIDFANAILMKNGISYLTAVSVAISPREGYVADWRINKLKEEAKRLGAVPAISSVSLLSQNELYASMGIAIKKGEYRVQIKKLVNLEDGAIIE